MACRACFSLRRSRRNVVVESRGNQVSVGIKARYMFLAHRKQCPPMPAMECCSELCEELSFCRRVSRVDSQDFLELIEDQCQAACLGRRSPALIQIIRQGHLCESRHGNCRSFGCSSSSESSTAKT